MAVQDDAHWFNTIVPEPARVSSADVCRKPCMANSAALHVLDCRAMRRDDTLVALRSASRTSFAVAAASMPTSVAGGKLDSAVPGPRNTCPEAPGDSNSCCHSPGDGTWSEPRMARAVPGGSTSATASQHVARLGVPSRSTTAGAAGAALPGAVFAGDLDAPAHMTARKGVRTMQQAGRDEHEKRATVLKELA